jgi:hypothetical protein
MAVNSERKTVSFEELSYSNMLTLTALIDLLEEKGITNKSEILDRVKRIRAEALATDRPQ